MNTDEVFHAGGVQIPNPNYSKSGKNKKNQPEYITVSDLGKTAGFSNVNSGLANMSYDAAKDNLQGVIGESKDLNKYYKYGVSPVNEENVDKRLANAQSNWEKAFNAVGQTLISEVGLGMLAGFTDLGDLVTSKILGITEDDYQNPASEAIKEWQDYFNEELAPIYADPSLNIQNGGLTDFGWWMKGMPQVASTFTLLLPTMGISKGISMLGKIGNIGKKLSKGASKARRWASRVEGIEDASKYNALQLAINNPKNIERFNRGVKNTAEGLLMRTMENYQEARDSHISTYEAASDKFSNMSDEEFETWKANNQELVSEAGDTTDKDSMAKLIAKKAADRTFVMDYANTIFDVIQLHGLKNIGLKFGAEKATGRAVIEAERQAKRAAASFAKGAAVEEVKKPIYKKALQGGWDFLKGNAKLIAEESTEGIEEAVNYIAQQEGLTYGKALLEGNAKDYRYTKGFGSYATLGIPNIIGTFTNLQGSMVDYMKSPELQESAFWGVFGGWAFGGAGSTFNRVKLAFDQKAAQERRKKNPITGESIEDKQGWLDFLELPSTKAAKLAINKRLGRLEQLKTDLSQIEKGTDIFGNVDDKGTLPSFTGTAEEIDLKKKLARAKVESKFINDIAIDAMNSGTYDSLIDYFKSDEVKSAMVTAGIAKEGEINARTEDIVRQLEATKDIYARQSAHVLNQIAAINGSGVFEDDIPLEYAQIIAYENTQNVLNLNALDAQIKAMEGEEARQHEVATDMQKDSDFSGAKEAIQIASIVNLYGQLTAQEKALEQEEKESGRPSWQLHAAKRAIKNKKEHLVKALRGFNLAGTSTSIGEAAVFTAMKRAKGYKIREDGAVVDNQAFEETDEDILKELSEAISDRSMSDETVLQMAKKLEADFGNVTSEQGLYGTNKKLFDIYTGLAALNLDKQVAMSNINSTQSQIKSRVDMLHNAQNEGRKQMLNLAEKTVIKALEQYDDVNTETGDKLMQVIFNLYQHDKQKARELIESTLPDSSEDGKVTAAEFMDALDIFNFTSRNNEALLNWMQQVIGKHYFNKNQKRKGDKNATADEEGESSSTQNPTNTDGQTSQPDNSSANPLEGLEQALAEEEEGTSNQQANQQTDNRPKKKVKIVFDKNGGFVSVKGSKNKGGTLYNCFENPDGSVELDISTLTKQEQLKLLTSGIFDGDIDLLDGKSTWKVLRNPTFKKKKGKWQLADKGEVTTQSTDPALEDVYNRIKQEIAADEAEGGTFGQSIREGTYTAARLAENYGVSKEDAARIIKRLLNDSSPVEDGSSLFGPLTSPTGERVGTQTDNTVNPVSEEDEGASTESEEATEETTEEQEEEQQAETEDNTNVAPPAQPTTPQPTPDENVNPDFSPAPTTQEEREEFERYVATLFGKYINLQASDIDFENALEKVRLDIARNDDKWSKIEYAQLVKDTTKKVADEIESAWKQVQSYKAQLDKNAAGLAFASKFEEPSSSNFSQFFVKSMEAFLDEYRKIVIVPSVDGKQVVKLEDILRICNNLYASDDTSVARSMYNAVYNYLNSPVGKAKYLTIDLNKRERVLDEINKTTEEKQQEGLTDLSKFRINIGTTVETARLNDNKNFFKVLDALKKGDKLDVTVTDSEIVFSKDGVIIGNIPMPSIVGDSYVKVNDGWVTDVKLDGNGNVISRTKDVMMRLFTGKTSYHDALRELLYKAALLSKNDPDYKDKFESLVEQFESNPLTKALYEQSRKDLGNGSNIIFVDSKTGQIDSDRVLKHISTIFYYANDCAIGKTVAEQKENFNKSVDAWFKKLYETYDTASNLKSTTGATVSAIDDGEQIMVTDDVVKDYDKLPSIADGISPDVDAAISVVAEGSMVASGMRDEKVKRFTSGSTFVTIFSNSPRPTYIKAVGAKLTDSYLEDNEEFKAMANTAYQAVYEAFVEYLNNPKDREGNSNFYKVEEIIKNIINIDGDRNRLSLFRAFHKAYTIGSIEREGALDKGIYICSKGPIKADGKRDERYFKIWTTTPKGGLLGFKDSKSKDGGGFDTIAMQYINRTNRETIARTLAFRFISFVKETANVNISPQAIKGDNGNVEETGFMRHENGKFVVDIPVKYGTSYHKEYNSYNAYLINNNLIKVNTNKNKKGTNFKNRSENLGDIPNLYVSLENKKDSKSKIDTGVTENADAATVEKVKEIAKTNKENAGLELFKTVLDSSMFNRLQEVDSEFNILGDLLPKSFTYDSLMNGRVGNKFLGAIAFSNAGSTPLYKRYSTGVGVTTRMSSGTSIVVGDYFMNMITSNSVEKRKEAIRKLIHEQLHLKIQQNSEDRAKILNNISEIYEEAIDTLTKRLEGLDKNSKEYKNLDYVRRVIDKNAYRGERKLEEFLVESLTNKRVFDFLNSIEVSDGKDNKKSDNLFTKIAKFIAKLFNWDIKDGTLFMKELNVLRDSLNPKSNHVNEEENIENKDESVEENKEEPQTNDDITSEDEEYEEDEDEDEDAYSSLFDEPSVDSDGFSNMFNADGYAKQLPVDLQAKFDSLLQQGYIEIKC